jgi:hypothetical protein
MKFATRDVAIGDGTTVGSATIGLTTLEQAARNINIITKPKDIQNQRLWVIDYSF